MGGVVGDEIQLNDLVCEKVEITRQPFQTKHFAKAPQVFRQHLLQPCRRHVFGLLKHQVQDIAAFLADDFGMEAEVIDLGQVELALLAEKPAIKAMRPWSPLRPATANSGNAQRDGGPKIRPFQPFCGSRQFSSVQ